jgi:hypothetical protein
VHGTVPERDNVRADFIHHRNTATREKEVSVARDGDKYTGLHKCYTQNCTRGR